MISAQQADSLRILRSYGVNVGSFIRAAIREKIKLEWKEIRERKNHFNCPF